MRYMIAVCKVIVMISILFACQNIHEKEADTSPEQTALKETAEAFDQRMEWWREARFGMFIHWGLYAIPAGEWGGNKNYGEWIRTSAQIPLETYDEFLPQFNPIGFDANAWVQMAKNAGMKYIVITSKHHDGFCLWDSEHTDYDVMSTPFKRDILKELAEACEKEGIALGFYHSIMDWHHPDYLPRRGWETNRGTEGADFDRYESYMKSQLKELFTKYGDIKIVWFDGEWEGTWTHEKGVDLYQYMRDLSPNVLINNRVDKGRGGMAGMTSSGFMGDFGTPEQEIPDVGLPGVDWESCMTMNSHWGFNKYDDSWKSSEDLIQKLTDIASKGGNYLLNIGPKADGTFPQESIDRLKEIGEWMEVNGASIYGTNASPFGLFDWGRVTLKTEGKFTKLYIHIFDWEKAYKGISLPGVVNDPVSAYALADKNREFAFKRNADAIEIQLVGKPIDDFNSVLVVTFDGPPAFYPLPEIPEQQTVFLNTLEVHLNTPDGLITRYTTDGSAPTVTSKAYQQPIPINEATVLKVRYFKGDVPISGISEQEFHKIIAQEAQTPQNPHKDIRYSYYEGEWDSIPDYSKLTPLRTGIIDHISLDKKHRKDNFGFDYEAWIQVPQDGIYTFSTTSDDGSMLYINGEKVVDNNGLHGMEVSEGLIALEKGFHKLRVSYFERNGSEAIEVSVKYGERQKISIDELVFR